MLSKSVRFLFLLMVVPVSAQCGSAQDQEYYELRVYRNSVVAKQQAILNHLEKALIPALNRLGSKTVGVFTPAASGGPASADVYVLIPFASLQKMADLRSALADDSQYQAAGAEMLTAPKDDPAYQRVESRLMKAFAGMPQLQVPNSDSSDRILEVRTYESHSDAKARLKVEMFNEGEIQIMKDVKLAPVFFGETLISDDLPNLTYMLSGDNADVHKQHFQDFLKHPDWDRMKRIEKYKGTVSKIKSVILKPATCSQI